MATQPVTAAPPPAKHKRSKSIAVVVLLVLAPIVFFIGSLATWVDRTALETSTWADVTEQIVHDPAVAAPLADALAQQLQAQAAFQERLTATLPPNLQPLAAPAAGALNELVQRGATRIVESPRGVELIVKASRITHAEVIKIIDGNTPLGDVSGGVVIDVSAVLSELAARLGLPDVASRLPAAQKQIVIMPKRNLSTVKTIVSALRAASTWLPILGIALFAGAVFLAGDRRRAVLWAAVGLVVVALLLVLSRIIVAGILPDAVATTESGKQAAAAVWRIVSAGLSDIARTIGAVGAFGVAGAWLVGPSARARKTRGVVAPWIRDPRYAFGGLAGILLLVIIWGPTRGARTPLTVVIVSALAILGLEVLRRQTAAEGQPAGGGSGTGLVAGVKGLVGRPSDAAELERLAQLHSSGKLTDEEYAAAKQGVLEKG